MRPGHFLIEGVKPGSLPALGAAAGLPHGELRPAQLTGSGTLMTIEAGQKIGDASIRMTPHGVIAGRVLDEDGEPMAWSAYRCCANSTYKGRSN